MRRWPVWGWRKLLRQSSAITAKVSSKFLYEGMACLGMEKALKQCVKFSGKKHDNMLS
jgi:hypothetical protein